jgi:hypothetical protein
VATSSPTRRFGSAAWPLAARAQQGERVRRIGVLTGAGEENDPVVQSSLSAFTQALAGLGWTDGRNVRMRPFMATQRSKRPSSPWGAGREAALSSCQI